MIPLLTHNLGCDSVAINRYDKRHVTFKGGICNNPMLPFTPARVCCRSAGRLSAGEGEPRLLDDRLSFPYIDAAWDTKCPNHTSKLVLISLSDHANSEGICWPSVGRLARRCDMDRRTVQRALRELEKALLLTTTGKKGNRSTYKLNLRLIAAPPAAESRATCGSAPLKPSVTFIKPRRHLAKALRGKAPTPTKSPEEVLQLIAEYKAELFRNL